MTTASHTFFAGVVHTDGLAGELWSANAAYINELKLNLTKSYMKSSGYTGAVLELHLCGVAGTCTVRTLSEHKQKIPADHSEHTRMVLRFFYTAKWWSTRVFVVTEVYFCCD